MTFSKNSIWKNLQNIIVWWSFEFCQHCHVKFNKYVKANDNLVVKNNISSLTFSAISLGNVGNQDGSLCVFYLHTSKGLKYCNFTQYPILYIILSCINKWAIKTKINHFRKTLITWSKATTIQSDQQ